MNQSEQQKQLQQILSSPQGKQLLKLLSKDGGVAMRSAGEAIKKGDTAGAQSIMGPMMEDPEVRKLLQTLEQSMNHG